jgi:hypothetical protein
MPVVNGKLYFFRFHLFEQKTPSVNDDCEVKNNYVFIMKRITFLCISLLCILALKAQTASVRKIWLEFDVTQNGVSGMKVHLTFDIQNMKGRNGRVIAYFDSPKGTGVKDKNGKYCTNGGNVCTSIDICPNYDNTIYDDLDLFIPIDELHLYPGKRNYYCRAFIQDLSSRKFLANSEFVSFEGTGVDNKSDNNSHAAVKKFPDKQTFYYTNSQHSGLVKAQFYYDNQNEPVCLISTGNSLQYYWWGSNSSNALEFYGFQYTAETQSKASPYGPIPMITYTGRIIKSKNSNRISLSSDYNKLVINNNYVYNVRISQQEYEGLWSQMFGNSGGGSNVVVPNGGIHNGTSGGTTTPSHQDTRCKYCHGTGNCSSCNGKGYKFNSYSGHDDTCPSCNGSGRCFNCRGTGRQR